MKPHVRWSLILVLGLSVCLVASTAAAAGPVALGYSPSAPGTVLDTLQPTLSWWPQPEAGRSNVVLLFRQDAPGRPFYCSPETRNASSFAVPKGVLAWNGKYLFVIETSLKTATTVKTERSAPRYFQTAQAMNLPCSGGFGGIGSSAGPCGAYSLQLIFPPGKTPPPVQVTSSGDSDVQRLQLALQKYSASLEARQRVSTMMHQLALEIIGNFPKRGPGLDGHHTTADRQTALKMTFTEKLEQPAYVDITYVNAQGIKETMTLLITPK